jgi:hypothetical protein
MRCMECGGEMVLLNAIEDWTKPVLGFVRETYMCMGCGKTEQRTPASLARARRRAREPAEKLKAERHAWVYLFSLSRDPLATAVNIMPAALRASVRIISADIPTSSRAISPSNSAVATAAVKPRSISTVRCMRRQ